MAEAPNKAPTTSPPISKWLIMGLMGFALLTTATRLWVLGGEHLAGGDQLWRLKIDTTVRAEPQATALQIYPPIQTTRHRIIQRSLYHPGFRIRNWSENKYERRSILAFASNSGQQTMSSEFFIHQLANPAQPIKKQPPLSNELREKYLRDTPLLQLSDTQVVQTLQTILQPLTDPSQRVEAIFKYLRGFKGSLQKNELSVPTTLTAQTGTVLDRNLSMVALSRAAGIPARMVTGLILKEDLDPKPHYWLEVYQDEKWQAYDIAFGYRQTLPANFLMLRRDGIDIVEVLNGELLQRDFELEREFSHPHLHQFKQKSLLNILDLSRLPVDSRSELAILMLLPLGALITALCRHLVGLHSYGVFTPTLLALAMVYTDMLTTLIIFAVVSSLAVAGRSLFPTTITRIPRLAIIFTLVAMILTFAASVMDYYELGRGQGVILLPIIILTSLVDRLYRTIEDKGLTIAMHRLVWTLLITLFCLPVVQFESLGQLLLNYPESHFFTLALFLLISSYKGPKLIKLPFIRWLAEPESKKSKKSISIVKETNDAS